MIGRFLVRDKYCAEAQSRSKVVPRETSVITCYQDTLDSLPTHVVSLQKRRQSVIMFGSILWLLLTVVLAMPWIRK